MAGKSVNFSKPTSPTRDCTLMELLIAIAIIPILPAWSAAKMTVQKITGRRHSFAIILPPA